MMPTILVVEDEPAIRELIARTLAALDAVESDTSAPTYASTLGALERATEALETSMGVVEHLESTATTPGLRDAYNAVLPDVSALWAGIPLRERLYQRLVAFSETAEARALEVCAQEFAATVAALARVRDHLFADVDARHLCAAVEQRFGVLARPAARVQHAQALYVARQ